MLIIIKFITIGVKSEMWSCMRHVHLKVLAMGSMGDSIYRRRPVQDGGGVALPLGVSN